MEPRLTALAAAQHGVLSSGDARRVDVPAVQLDTLERAGELVRVRRGAYVLGAPYRAASPEERYRLRTRAICARALLRMPRATTPLSSSTRSTRSMST